MSGPPATTAGARRLLALMAVQKYAVSFGGALIMLVPIIWVVSGSFKTDAEIVRSTSFLPHMLTWENYAVGWRGAGIGFGTFLFNSSVLCLMAVAANLFACSLAGYAFARLRFPAKSLLFGIMLLTIIIPKHISLIPEYIIFQKLGLVNTFVPLVLPKLLGTDGFFIFLICQFVKALPREIEEAGIVDGCNRLQVFLLIVLPNMVPALATTAILTFIFTYQDFLSQLIYLNSPDRFTVPLGLQSFVDSTTSSALGATFAMSVVSMLPVVLVFLFFQRRIVDGVATSGLKG